MTKKSTPLFLGVFALLGLQSAMAASFTTPSGSYHSFSDSPFAGGSFSWFYLNTFETNSLSATPGVSASGGDTSLNSGFSGSIVDSVDFDDGLLDNQCNIPGGTCHSWFNGDGATGVTFTFNAGVLGSLPTSAGIVWTDGFGTVTFTAYGPGMVVLGSRTNADGSWTPGGSFSDQDTNEDHFFGVTDAGGILAIKLTNSSGGIEMDHLQYGLAGVAGVPEPGTGLLMAAALALGSIGYLLRRR